MSKIDRNTPYHPVTLAAFMVTIFYSLRAEVGIKVIISCW